MKILNTYDQLLAYTIKMSRINYIKRIHCYDTYIEFAHKGIAIPMSFIGIDNRDPVYITRLEYFPDIILRKIVYATSAPTNESDIIAYTISTISGILVIRNLITNSKSLEIPVYQPRKSAYSLPY
jgi:hypothetical protein